MRVGLVIYGPLETVSGGFLYDRKLVDYLRRSGDHVEIISLRRRSYAANLSGSAGLSGSEPNFTLVLNDSFADGSRTGLTSASSAPAGTVVILR